LRLLGRTSARDRLLDGPRRVLVHGSARVAGAAERGPPRLAELERAVRVAMHEDSLDGDLVRGVGIDELGDVAMDREQAPGHLSLAHPDAAAGHVTDALTSRIHDAVARDSRAGVEAEDSHHGSYDSH